MNQPPIDVLVIEDDPANAHLTLIALRDAAIESRVHVIGDGEEALAFLKRQGKYASAPRPSLVLLDLHLPKLDGHQLLAAIKCDIELRRIPVVVLSSSTATDDIERAYDLQVSCFLVKPLEVDQYFAAIRCVKQLYFHTAVLPRARAATSSG